MVITSPAYYGVPTSIKNGALWAGDNSAFVDFNEPRWMSFLEHMIPYSKTCLFMVAPDSVGNAIETLDKFRWYAWRIKNMGYPVAFVAQDGQESHPLPPEYDTLFIGGSTKWKLSHHVEKLIEQAQANYKHIHIGRINYWRRYHHFRGLPGSEKFTCDGTRTKFGRDQALKDWRKYEDRPYQIRWTLFSAHHTSES